MKYPTVFAYRAWSIGAAFGLSAAAVLIGATPVYAACPLSINYAGYIAIGSAHHTAEYVIELDSNGDRLDPSFSVQLTAGWDSGATIPLTINNVALENRGLGSHGSATLLAVLPYGGVRWIQIDGLNAGSSQAADCSADPKFTLTGSLYDASQTFDDGAAWIASDSPTVIQIVGPRIIHRVSPDYPSFARERGDQGDVTITAIIGADGTATDIEVNKSSGSGLLDASSVAAAKAWKFAPAMLPANLGGAPVPIKVLIINTFALVQ
jgi:TonB family protein